MARKGKERIIIATGPYRFTEDTLEYQLPHVSFRHFKAEEISQAKAWVRQYRYTGDYYFDWYLLNQASREIIERLQPLDICDAIPWMYRIDCVVQRPGTDLIVEFTERVRSSSIGQLAVYQDLYEKQMNRIGKTTPVMVVYDDEPTLHPVMEQLGIKLEVVRR